jgi:cytosine/adenosine deaminase-related metal-dependent hydrolase
MEMFRERRGALFDFLKGLGRRTEDCGGRTPLAVFLESAGIMSDHARARWIVAHLNELAEEDFMLLARALEFHIAHCPRSHRYFQHPPFKRQRLRDLGCNICLATDSLASNSDLSLFAEMRLLHELEPHVPTQTLVEMVTVNPAKALGRAHDLGRIAPGYLADLIAIPFEGPGDWFSNVINFAGRVPWMMIGGHVSLEEA